MVGYMLYHICYNGSFQNRMNVLSEQDGWVFAAQYLNILFQNRMNILSEQDGWLFAVSENIISE